MTWALKRQILFLMAFVLLVFLFGWLVLHPILNPEASCFDGKKNGQEKGIDCGGDCLKACDFEADNISVLWTRSFEVIPGRYNAIAYLENKNKNLAIQKIKYRFRFADKDNIYVGKREGETFIPPGGKFALFESAIGVGNSVPVYTTFEFTSEPVWVKVSEEKIDQLKIFISDIQLEDSSGKPRLSAKVQNGSLFTIPAFGVVAILYDKQGNAVNASRTYLESLGPEQSQEINFTWPRSIQTEIIVKELIPAFNIFSVQLK